ncbi:Multidrug export protein MepA [Hartmannibacter diazotrophicus]|uniref:Multidrug-efflux transporter n=1 Tax=Hartmannibacter diazotrophicus TaxID=1482074 RepID=A0A2C9D8M2_9HYPH|nr:MATE family efflux transporter [Hartmannibacter diazotrophicus]SON56672.1 Multidrug export protein MepA [Hartmannibacter diazotrophicus]
MSGPSPFAPADLGAGPVRPLILRLAAPAVVGLSVNAAHQTINAVFVGMLGAEALAAVTLTLPVLMLGAALGEGLGAGACAEIARSLGAGNRQRAGTAASISLLACLPVATLLTFAGLFFTEPLLRLFGASDASLPLAVPYVRIMALGMVLTLIQVVCDFVAIGEGNSRFSMGTLIAGFSLNIILDPILIFGLGLGVEGAALATILSQVVVLAAYGSYFLKGWSNLKLALPGAFDLKLLRPVIAIGLPVTLSSFLTAAAFALAYKAAAETAGDAGVAAIGIALRLVILGTLPIVGFALGGQPVLGYAFGNGAQARLREATYFMVVAASLFCMVYGFGVAAFARPLAGIFTDDPEVLVLGASAIVAIHLAFPLTGLRLVLLVLLQATERPKLAAVISVSAQGFLLAPPLLVLPGLFGFAAVPLSVAGGIAVAGAMSMALLWPILFGQPRPATAVPIENSG